MTQAPIIPLLARWDGAVVDVGCGESIAADDDEATMAHALAAVLERHLLAHPEAIGGQLLEQLNRAEPRARPRATP
jgi:hypothetical protein